MALASRTRIVRHAGLSLLAVAALLSGPLLNAQAAVDEANAKTPVYEVVSVKPNNSGNGGMSYRGTGDGFVATNTTLMNLLQGAYGIKDELIYGAPGWATSQHFDIQGKIAAEDLPCMKTLTQAQRREMSQSVLRERFKLQAHVENKVLPIYEMVIAKGGIKAPEEVKPTDPEIGFSKLPEKPTLATMCSGCMMINGSTMTAKGIPLSQLASQLAYNVHRTVVDKTGLPGKYDIALNWTPDEAAAAGTDAGPSIYTALQEQLGLKLQASKGPVDTLVIDHVEMPTED